MKLPSLNYLWINARTSLLRFPLTVVSALVAVTLGVYLTEYSKVTPNTFPYINALLCAALGVPLYFCVAVLSSKMQFHVKKQFLFNALATGILIAVYFSLPGSDSTHNTSLPYVKYGIYNITVHLLVSFVPFLFSAQLNGFWQYNKVLFIRFLTSGLYSAVLYLGLVLALGALKLLFDIHLHDKLFFDLFIVIGGFMTTWFFVSGIPNDLDALDANVDYPKGLKIFAQYILLPLLALYLIILYFYGGKILILWNWPKGIVSYLIVYISVLGILTFLLLHPYGNSAANQWIRKISKAYYLALFPLLVILFIAIFMRVGDYGITISRYSILLLGLWLSVLCSYIAFGGSNIKFIPSSLAIMILLTSFGPWGMFSVSERSQVKRLKEILQHQHLLVDDKIKNEVIWVHDTLFTLHSPIENTNEGQLNDSLHNEVWSILEYLDDHHGFNAVKGWFSQNIDSMLSRVNAGKNKWERSGEAETYMRSMGLRPNKLNTGDEELIVAYHAELQELNVISGYDYRKNFEKRSQEKDSTLISFTLDSCRYSIQYSFKKGDDLVLRVNNKRFGFGLNECIISIQKKYGSETQVRIPQNEMQVSISDETFNFVLQFHTLEVYERSGSLHVEFIGGDLLIKRLKPE